MPMVMMIGLLQKEPDVPPQQSKRYGVRIIEPILDVMGIERIYIDSDADLPKIAPAIEKAYSTYNPVALVIGRADPRGEHEDARAPGAAGIVIGDEAFEHGVAILVLECLSLHDRPRRAVVFLLDWRMTCPDDTETKTISTALSPASPEKTCASSAVTGFHWSTPTTLTSIPNPICFPRSSSTGMTWRCPATPPSSVSRRGFFGG